MPLSICKTHSSNTPMITASSGTLGQYHHLGLSYKLVYYNSDSSVKEIGSYTLVVSASRHGKIVRTLNQHLSWGYTNLTKTTTCDIFHKGFRQLFIRITSLPSSNYLFEWDGVKLRRVYYSFGHVAANPVKGPNNSWAVLEDWQRLQFLDTDESGAAVLNPMGGIRRYLVPAGDHLAPLPPRKSSVHVTSLAIVPRYKLLVIGGPSDTVSVYNAVTYQLLKKLHLHELPTHYSGVHGIASLLVTACGNELFGGGLGVPMEAVSIPSLHPLFIFPFASQNDWISYPHTFGVIGNDKLVVNRTFGHHLTHGLHYQEIPQYGVAATCLASGITVVVNNATGNISLYNDKWHLMRKAGVPEIGDDIENICISSNSKVIAGLTYNAVTIWSANKLHVISRLAAKSTAISLSPTGNMLAVAVQNRIDLFDTRDMHLVASRVLGWKITSSMLFSVKGNRLFTADGDRVYVLSVPSLSIRSVIHLK